MSSFAEVEFLDEQLGNLTSLLKQKGMWNDTLLVLTADNGGYVEHTGPCSVEDPVKGYVCMTGEAGASNYPLRGGKYSLLEGGIRANSFVSGGFLPGLLLLPARRFQSSSSFPVLSVFLAWCGLLCRVKATQTNAFHFCCCLQRVCGAPCSMG